MRTDGSGSISAELADAAFGATPGRWPLPAAVGAVEHWHRAVALGGQGHYRGARAELRAAWLLTRSRRLRSLIWSTAASGYRQLGWHTAARALDGHALAEAVPTGSLKAVPTGSPDVVSAAVDALVGLAADALGTGRLSLAGRLLDSGSRLVADHPDWRSSIRLSWVRAELELARGDAAAALESARVGAAAAAVGPSVRHRVKSELLVAAATAATGATAAATDRAIAVAADCARHRLLPLRWAALMLRAGLGDSREAAAADRIAAEIAERGAYFRHTGSENIGVLNWPRGPAGYC